MFVQLNDICSPEKLKNVQNELVSLQQKLKESREAMREKELAKRRLEKKVEMMKLQLHSERKTTEELVQESNSKIERLQQKIEGATGGEKAQLIQRLKEEKELKDELSRKQSDLEKEMQDIKQQIKEEEKKAVLLEEETKRKEEEKKNLDKVHKEKMRELKKKLLDIVLDQEYTHRKIGDAIAETEKLGVEADGIKVVIKDTKEKIEVTINDKEQIERDQKEAHQGA